MYAIEEYNQFNGISMLGGRIYIIFKPEKNGCKFCQFRISRCSKYR